jgi:hypothetical protein
VQVIIDSYFHALRVNNLQKPIYGIATSIEFWKFGKLIEKKFVLDSRAYSATDKKILELQEKWKDQLNQFYQTLGIIQTPKSKTSVNSCI